MGVVGGNKSTRKWLHFLAHIFRSTRDGTKLAGRLGVVCQSLAIRGPGFERGVVEDNIPFHPVCSGAIMG